MTLTPEKLESLRELINGAPRKIALLCHTNPDGDTIGAALAWRAYLEKVGPYHLLHRSESLSLFFGVDE